jgi:hypothetical protein
MTHEIENELQKKYKGFVRSISFEFKDEKQVYNLTWRPWVIEASNEDMITYSCMKKYDLTLSKELIDNEGITDIFDEIDKTIVLSPVMAKMFASFKSHYVKVPKGLV